MKIDRLISIIMILSDRRRINAQELANMFEVSLRTIYRDIESINMAGIPIYSIPGSGGGFEIMEEYKIDNKVFSTEDLSTIVMALTNFFKMTGTNEMNTTLAKVRSFVPIENAKDIEYRTNQVNVDVNPWIGNTLIQPYLVMIKAALKEHQILSFEYTDLHQNKTSRVVEPYQLVLKNGQWYFQGYCLEKEDFRLFKLARMANLKKLNKIFSPRSFQQPILDITDVLEKIQITIIIRIHKSVMDRVLDFCSIDNFEPDGAEHYIVHFPFIENDFYYSILLSFGTKCECLEPLHIRDEMKKKVEEIYSLYFS